MGDDQRHGRIFGLLFIATFITSISALALFLLLRRRVQAVLGDVEHRLPLPGHLRPRGSRHAVVSRETPR